MQYVEHNTGDEQLFRQSLGTIQMMDRYVSSLRFDHEQLDLLQSQISKLPIREILNPLSRDIQYLTYIVPPKNLLEAKSYNPGRQGGRGRSRALFCGLRSSHQAIQVSYTHSQNTTTRQNLPIHLCEINPYLIEQSILSSKQSLYSPYTTILRYGDSNPHITDSHRIHSTRSDPVRTMHISS